jgi:hypothetical protein
MDDAAPGIGKHNSKSHLQILGSRLRYVRQNRRLPEDVINLDLIVVSHY